MSRPRTLAVLLAAGLLSVLSARPAAAAIPPAGAVSAAPAFLDDAAPAALQDVRYERRCRRVVVERVRPSGRVVRERRNLCRNVWVGPPRGRAYRY